MYKFQYDCTPLQTTSLPVWKTMEQQALEINFFKNNQEAGY